MMRQHVICHCFMRYISRDDAIHHSDTAIALATCEHSTVLRCQSLSPCSRHPLYCSNSVSCITSVPAAVQTSEVVANESLETH